jgi:penicillin amidase
MLNPKDFLPDLESSYQSENLIENVKIYRDQWGIPHISAENENDLFFAQGFSIAQDRLFQMDLDRLRCLGRSSEYLGKKAISNDKLNIKRNFETVAKADLRNASDSAKNMIKNFTKGVNFYLSNTSVLPLEYNLLEIEPELWEDWHSILIYKIRNAAEGSFNGKLFYSQLSNEIGPEKAAKLIPGYFPGALLTLPPGTNYSGQIKNAVEELTEAAENFKAIGAIDGESNGWSISGEKSYSGFPLVGGDSHRTLDTPNVYYQVHLKCDTFEGMGHTIPGYPGFMHFSHNKNVAWGMTHGGADTQDIFIEKLRYSNNKIQQFYDKKWINTEHFKKDIFPRNEKKIQIDVIKTINGNVIFGNPNDEYALSLSDPGGLDEGTYWIDSAYEAMKSKSADDLEKAFDKWTDRTNNYPYADINKNFGYKFAGSVPVRDKQHEWGIAKGWEEKYLVNKEIPRDELPKSRNPKEGWVVTCNQQVVDYDYPYFMSVAFAPEYRAKVLVNYIQENSKNLKIENMLEMHNQKFSIPAEKMISYCKSMNLSENKLSKLEKEGIDTLYKWDFLMDKHSSGASIYIVTKEKIIEEIIKLNYANLAEETIQWKNYGAVSHVRRFLTPLINEHFGDDKSFLLNKKDNWKNLFENSFKEAISFLELKFGNNIKEWKWGNLHKTNHQHPLSSIFEKYSKTLNPKKVSASGDNDTPLAGSYDKNYNVIAASVNRYAHDPSKWENSRWIVPLGSSGNPGSENYYDQLDLWANGETIPQIWDWNEIKKNYKKQTLSKT